MKQYHPEEWSKLCQYTGILKSRRYYKTKKVQDFILKSTETLGDEMVATYRKTIKSLQRAALLCAVCGFLAGVAIIVNGYTGWIEPNPQTIRFSIF